MMLYFSHFLVKNNTLVHLCSAWFSPQEIKSNLKYHMYFIKMDLTEERIPENFSFSKSCPFSIASTQSRKLCYLGKLANEEKRGQTEIPDSFNVLDKVLSSLF